VKIGIYLGNLAPQAAGGFTFQDDIFAALLRAKGFENLSFVILSRSPPTSFISYANERLSFARLSNLGLDKIKNLVNLLFPFVGRLGRLLGIRSGLDRLLDRHSVQMVWFVSPFYATTERPYIYTIWDLQHRVQPWFPEVSKRGRWEYRDNYYRRAIQRAYFTITPNSAGQAEVERFYGVQSARVRICPHPTPAFALNSSNSPTAGIYERYKLSPGFLFYPAQFGPHKNHAALLRALQILRNKHGIQPDLALVGPDLGNLEHVRSLAAKCGVSQQVHVLGFVPREDLVSLYREASALVYPSYFGPENLPPLEAFALGCPVLAARVMGSEEQLGDAALLFDPTDPESIAGAILQLNANNELRQQLIERGRLRAKAWTADDYVSAVLSEITRFAQIRECWSD
jgi:glycosyltransferase involved in cell wall biosynthesis